MAMGSMGIVRFGGQEKGHLSALWALSKELVSHAEEPLLQAPALL